jgi:hypothetical protein
MAGLGHTAIYIYTHLALHSCGQLAKKRGEYCNMALFAVPLFASAVLLAMCEYGHRMSVTAVFS